MFGACHRLSRDALYAQHRQLVEELMMAVRTAEKGIRGNSNDDQWVDALHDHVSMTFQFGVDGVHEAFEESLLPAGW